MKCLPTKAFTYTREKGIEKTYAALDEVEKKLAILQQEYEFEKEVNRKMTEGNKDRVAANKALKKTAQDNHNKFTSLKISYDKLKSELVWTRGLLQQSREKHKTLIQKHKASFVITKPVKKASAKKK